MRWCLSVLVWRFRGESYTRLLRRLVSVYTQHRYSDAFDAYRLCFQLGQQSLQILGLYRQRDRLPWVEMLLRMYILHLSLIFQSHRHFAINKNLWPPDEYRLQWGSTGLDVDTGKCRDAGPQQWIGQYGSASSIIGSSEALWATVSGTSNKRFL